MKRIRIFLAILGLAMMFGTSVLLSVNNQLDENQVKTLEIKEKGFGFETVQYEKTRVEFCYCRFNCNDGRNTDWVGPVNIIGWCKQSCSASCRGSILNYCGSNGGNSFPKCEFNN